MSEAKHTPERWALFNLPTNKATEHPHKYRTEIRLDSDGRSSFSMPSIIVANGYGDTPEEADNRARLIAAAPDMIASMEEMLSLVEFWSKREMEAPANNQEAVIDTREKLKRFRVAISKAKVSQVAPQEGK